MSRKIALAVCLAIVALVVLAACREQPFTGMGYKPATIVPARVPTRPGPAPTPVQFVPVRDILAQTCAVARCHNAENVAGRLDLSPERAYENLVGVKSNQHPVDKLVSPGEPQHSYLLAKLRGESGIKGARMPIGRDPLPPEQIAIIERWIADGAKP